MTNTPSPAKTARRKSGSPASIQDPINQPSNATAE
jgi:hypothetical protein